MRTFAIKAAAGLATITLLAACDITAIDNYSAPTSVLSGHLVFQGQRIGVRTRALQLELWQPGEEWQLNTKIPVWINQDGSFRSVTFDGRYELNVIPGAPWIHDPTRIPVELRGEALLDVPVVPYYVIRNERIVNNNGTIEATFDVGQINTTRALEFVGLYVGTTEFVDRINQVVRVERPRAQIADLNAPVNLILPLPANIHVMRSPAPRERVQVRIGVKTAGIAEMLFTQVHKIDI
jgi:hypothetical protein